MQAMGLGEGGAVRAVLDSLCANLGLDRLWRNTDDADRGLTRKVLAGDYTWLEEGILDQSEGTGPWIADASHGPSSKEDLHRRYR